MSRCTGRSRRHEDRPGRPAYEAVPPRLYGGTERIVAHLTDALVELGHDVTLFASAEARDPGQAGAGARSGDPARSGAAEVRPRRAPVDAARGAPPRGTSSTSSTSTSTCSTSRSSPSTPARTVTTLHGRLDLKDLPDAYRAGRSSRWSRSPTTSAGRCPSQLARAPCITASPTNLYRFTAAAAARLPRLPGPHLAGEAARPGDRDRQAAPACR